MTDPTPVTDPREVLRPGRGRRDQTKAQHQTSEDSSPGELIANLLDVQSAWLIRRVRSVATSFQLDADDLIQEVMIRLLRSSHIVDAKNRGIRTWLATMIARVAVDMARRRSRETSTDPDDLI